MKKPILDVRYPTSEETKLIAGMRQLAIGHWSPSTSPVGRPSEDGFWHFRRTKGVPATVNLFRVAPGHCNLSVTPDNPGSMSIESYLDVVKDFETTIAMPAVTEIGGITQLGIARDRLEDHFSGKALAFLNRYLETGDDDKWIAFLLLAHKDGKAVHCDIFGECLKDDYPRLPEERRLSLRHDYDLAMTVLQAHDKGQSR